MHNPIHSLTLPSALELSKIEIHAKSGHMGPYSAQFVELIALIHKQEAALKAATTQGIRAVAEFEGYIDGVEPKFRVLGNLAAGAKLYAAPASSPEIPDSSVTVDTPEFGTLLRKYKCAEYADRAVTRIALIAHIDAHTSAAVARAVKAEAARCNEILVAKLRAQAAPVAASQPNPQASTYPREIWLQAGECTQDEALPYNSGLELTWCFESIDRMDVRYVRADLAHTQQPAAVPTQPLAGELPVLPEPSTLTSDYQIGYTAGHYKGYCMGIEKAAKLCDGVNNYDNPMTARDLAAAIRAINKTGAV